MTETPNSPEDKWKPFDDKIRHVMERDKKRKKRQDERIKFRVSAENSPGYELLSEEQKERIRELDRIWEETEYLLWKLRLRIRMLKWVSIVMNFSMILLNVWCLTRFPITIISWLNLLAIVLGLLMFIKMFKPVPK